MTLNIRIATYNVENLFGRAKVLNFAQHDTGSAKMKRIGELQGILQKETYSSADRDRAGHLYKDLKSFIGYNMLRSDVGYYLFRKHDADGDGEKETYRLAPRRRDQWLGFLTYDRDKFSDQTSKNTARVIREVDADVICINEVEDRLVLDRFNADRLGRMYPYNILIDGKSDPRGIDVGVYSKFPIGRVRTNIFAETAEGKAIFSRDCLEVEILTPAGSVFLLANHLKSKYQGGDEKRKAQAHEIRRILETRYDLQHQYVAVLGDLNDTPDSDPLSPLVGMGDLTDVLNTPVGPVAGQRWTYRYKDAFNQIDYILVSDALQAGLRSAGIERRGMPPENLNGSNAGVQVFPGVSSWRDAGSDHGAVFADFELS
ncbi:endonuclease/exonuclease/phosphatase family protein [Halocynthiibacter sp.]|uniref:endonuclease/exonuclease/phosphatase family protein n=1 Tax=Halocynthiibacter sp. TaxID=1979210 RepID=UPI003C6403D3